MPRGFSDETHATILEGDIKVSGLNTSGHNSVFVGKDAASSAENELGTRAQVTKVFERSCFDSGADTGSEFEQSQQPVEEVVEIKVSTFLNECTVRNRFARPAAYLPL